MHDLARMEWQWQIARASASTCDSKFSLSVEKYRVCGDGHFSLSYIYTLKLYHVMHTCTSCSGELYLLHILLVGGLGMRLVFLQPGVLLFHVPGAHVY